MVGRLLATWCLLSLLVSAAYAQYGAPQSAKKEKSVWNFDGGLTLMTDGSIPDGPCFRVTGLLSAPNFFDNLKRTDTGSGPIIHRGRDVVTQFPERMHLLFELYDIPCSDKTASAATPRIYLSKEIISKMRLKCFWKRGLELRPAEGVALTSVHANLIEPYDTENKEKLPEKFEWWFDLNVPSAGVPVTDSLVIVLLTHDEKIAARVAARM